MQEKKITLRKPAKQDHSSTQPSGSKEFPNDKAVSLNVEAEGNFVDYGKEIPNLLNCGQVVVFDKDNKIVKHETGVPEDLPEEAKKAWQEFVKQESIEAAVEQQKSKVTQVKLPEPVDISELDEEEKQRVVNVILKSEERLAAYTGSRSTTVPPENLENNPKQQKEDCPKEENKSWQKTVTSGTNNQISGGDPSNVGLEKNPEEEKVFVSEKDLMAFYTAELLNCSKTRFTKSYSMLGRRIEITLRTARSHHVDMVWNQIKLDQQNEKLKTVEDLWRTLIDYSVVVCLHSITIANQKYLLGDEIENILDSFKPRSSTGDTPLPDILDQLKRQEPLVSEPLWRLVVQSWKRFDRLIKAIEEKLLDQSFC